MLIEFLTLPSRLYVNASQTANTGDGLTWATAFTALQSALTYPCSTSLTEIWVAAGTYKPTTTTDRGASFAMRNGVAIYGGFVGVSSETALSQRNWQTNQTILSGNIGNTNATTDNSFHVIFNSPGLTSSAVLDGFVITAGNANGSSPNNAGGGMFNNGRNGGCSPSLTNCSFLGNAASSSGGAIYNNGSNDVNSNSSISSPRLTNCSFQGNTAGFGGAMYNYGASGISSPSLTNCSFQGNTAYFGAAMYNYGASSGISSPTLTNCVLFGNLNIGAGGGNTFDNQNASATATYSLFDNTNNVNVTGPGNLITTTLPFASTADLHLICGSPAINAGTNTGAPATDIEGNPRALTVADPADMGAYEKQGSCCVTPTAYTVTGGGGYCAGGSGVAIGLSGSETGISYQLKNDNANVGNAVAGTGTALNFGTFTTAGTYTVVATRSAGCTATMTGSATVSVNAPPSVSITGLAASYCKNAAAVTLTGSPTGGSFTIDSNPATSLNPASLSVGPHSVVYAYTDANACSNSATQSVTVNALPTVSITGLEASYCKNAAAVTLTGSPAGGSFTIDGNPATSLNPASLSVGPHSVVYSYTDPGTTCSNSATQSVEIGQPVFTQAATVNTTLLCAGQPLTLNFNVNCPTNATFSAELSTASGTFPGYTFPNAVTAGSANTLTIPAGTPAGTGYKIRVNGSNPSLSSSSTAFSVSTPSFPSTPTVTGVPVCAGVAVTVNFGVSGCPAGSLFNLQLSDASGSFASGTTNLGQFPAGSQIVLIPTSVPAGSGYRIRVVATGGGPTSNPSAAFRIRACGNTRLASEASEEVEGLQVRVSPNPTEGLLRMTITGAAGQALRVELFNGAGQRTRQQGIDSAVSEETLSWDIARQPAGLYLLRVSGEREAKTLKVLH
ncbi:MAG: T9SS type A sorting domain-containing protein [Cytophagaceae bacterium]|nr:T9SS type A sorting domain-containing protein [Cytophagaceae bacterium]